ncbi:hypothetical protein BMETH_1297_0 [methanotrophic bacterial endosymbiont of Bathymodiolus sp.]|nr:hypothetical protein BMETH_1297_0 [methanotrophic bacterial endosymbiont of Bathymodiolus sp.]
MPNTIKLANRRFNSVISNSIIGYTSNSFRSASRPAIEIILGTTVLPSQTFSPTRTD